MVSTVIYYTAGKLYATTLMCLTTLMIFACRKKEPEHVVLQRFISVNRGVHHTSSARGPHRFRFHEVDEPEECIRRLEAFRTVDRVTRAIYREVTFRYYHRDTYDEYTMTMVDEWFQHALTKIHAEDAEIRLGHVVKLIGQVATMAVDVTVHADLVEATAMVAWAFRNAYERRKTRRYFGSGQ